MKVDSPASPLSDPLLDLELRVARRADELARAARPGTTLNLHWWLIAEQEVLGQGLGRIELAPTPVTP